MNEQLIYFDNAATTPLRKEALDAMIPYFSLQFGNPSSVYKLAQESKTAIEQARNQVAKAINALPEEIFFTSGGTESDNWAIKGFAEANRHKGNHIITTTIEHHAVLHVCAHLEKQGFEVTYINVNEYGQINPEDIQKAIRPTTILITAMFANNEVGTILPVAKIGMLAKEHNIAFHTDAVQAVGHIPVNVKEMCIDLLSFSAHKFYGPKGIGVLYVKKGIKLARLFDGGAQESNKRAGTENVPAIVGMAKALTLSLQEMSEESTRLTILRDYFIESVLKTIPNTKLNGHPTQRLPGNANISFQFIEGESMLILLDMKGFAASSGSACTSGSLDPSHVLLAMGLKHEDAHGTLRISLGRQNTKEQIDYLLAELPPIVERLRAMSPLYTS